MSGGAQRQCDRTLGAALRGEGPVLCGECYGLHVGGGRGRALRHAGAPGTQHLQSWPRFWANLRPLIGIFSQNVVIPNYKSDATLRISR